MMNEGKVFVLMVVVAPSLCSSTTFLEVWMQKCKTFFSRLFCVIGFIPIHPTNCNIHRNVTDLNLGHRDLVILCVHLLVVAEDVSQLVVVLVLVLVEDLEVDSLRTQIGETVVKADLVVSVLLRAQLDILSANRYV